jgi:hypothetical protein
LAVTGVEIGNGIEYSIDAGQTWGEAFTAVEGGNVVLVRQFDGKGSVSPGTPLEFTLDTQAPLRPGLSLANDTGSSGSDRITSDGSLSLSGVEAGANVEYSIDGGRTWSASFTAGEGGNRVVVRQIDLAGNVSSAGSELLALYRFDDPANAGLDSSGRGAMAVNFGASVGGEGYQDGAALFDGTTYFRSPVDVSVEALPRLTWGAWVKPSNTNPIRAVLSADDGGYDRDIDIDYRGNGVPEWSAFTGNGVVGSGVAPSTTDWVFVAAVYDQAQAIVTLYVGDTAVTATTSFGPSYTFFDIGHNPGSGEFFEGAIDNVFVYGEALTASQIADIRMGGFSSDNSASLSFEFTLDTQAAAAPTVSLTRDTGTNITDRITSVADLTIGNVESGATVEYSVDGGTVWSPSFNAVEGTNVLEVRQVDVAGNRSPGTQFAFTLDTRILPLVPFHDSFGTLMPDGIAAATTLDFSGCTVPLTFTLHPDGSLTVEDTRNPSANGLTFKSFGDIVGGQTVNRFVFVGSATMKGSVSTGNPSGITGKMNPPRTSVRPMPSHLTTLALTMVPTTMPIVPAPMTNPINSVGSANSRRAYAMTKGPLAKPAQKLKMRAANALPRRCGCCITHASPSRISRKRLRSSTSCSVKVGSCSTWRTRCTMSAEIRKLNASTTRAIGPLRRATAMPASAGPATPVADSIAIRRPFATPSCGPRKIAGRYD